MPDNTGGWKPWKDGFLENSTKVAGSVMFFLFISGLLGAGYDPVKSNPYVWGLAVRVSVINMLNR